jgi:RNA polymerase sigma factor (sigma-70 family)
VNRWRIVLQNVLIDRSDLDRAALQLLARHGAQIMATARRYAATAEDAEDAYQRGLEILLTKAPTTREAELVPWLKTVVKHEAFALRRQRDRLTPVTGDGEPAERGTAPAATHDQAERYERLSQGAEALGRLKPQEIRCLVLKAQGLTYREICEVTGWTYTKVNRCLTEGRQALTVQLAGIEGGIECARLAPLLSALADGEATAEQLAVLRPHMRTCLACRARLREFRAAPARVAALVPAGLVGASAPPGGALEPTGEALEPTAGSTWELATQGKLEALTGALQQKAEALLGATQHKAAALAERAHAAAELATAQKVAAVAASAAALAGGGTAVDQLANHRGPPRPAAAPQAAPPPTEQTVATAPSPAPLPPSTEQPDPPEQAAPAAPATQAAPPPPPPDPANEFAPTNASAAPASSAPATPAPATATPAKEPGQRPAPPVSRSAEEFAPGEFAP